MTVKEVTVSVGYTKNLGNYESLRLDASATAVLGEGEDPNEVYSTLWDKTSEEVMKSLADFEDDRKVKKGLK